MGSQRLMTIEEENWMKVSLTLDLPSLLFPHTFIDVGLNRREPIESWPRQFCASSCSYELEQVPLHWP